MRYDVAKALADKALSVLAPYCQRIEIGGSLRRLNREVHDIELIVIPKYQPCGLFSDDSEVDPEFIKVVRGSWLKVKGEPTGRYTQRRLPGGMLLDIFIATPQNFGWILALRTGSSDFNQAAMLPALKARGYVMDEGYIWQDGVKLSTPEEQDVFAIAGIGWIEPEKRIGPLTRNGR